MVHLKIKRLSRNDQNTFLSRLKNEGGPGRESVVQGVFDTASSKYFVEPDNYAFQDRPVDCDEFTQINNFFMRFSILAEFKDTNKLDNDEKRIRVLGQLTYYLKRLENVIYHTPNSKRYAMPSVVYAADNDTAMILNAQLLEQKLKLNINWKQNPRKIYDTGQPKELLDAICKDANIKPLIFKINAKNFSFNTFFDYLAQYANHGHIHKMPTTPENIKTVYNEFEYMVIDPSNFKYNDHTKVELFMRSITDYTNASPVPKKNLVTFYKGDQPNGTYHVSVRNWDRFFSYYETNYTLEQKNKFNAIADRLLREMDRRKRGEYWTPTVWANNAIDCISNVLGADWRQKYITWDPAAGSKNLTRGYHDWKALYSSTLYQAELNIGSPYNTGKTCHAFTYNFINDDINVKYKKKTYKNGALKLDKKGQPKFKVTNINCLGPNSKNSILQKKAPKLFNALVNDKPIVFFTNPPYGTSGSLKIKKSQHKSGIAATNTNALMKSNKIGRSSEQLYAQFFYRILNLKKMFNLHHIVIAFFSNPQFLTGGSYYSGLNKAIFSNFKLEDGFLFNANEFQGTSKSAHWGISFTVLKNKSDHTIQRKFPLKVQHTDPKNKNKIITDGIHIFYNHDINQLLSSWPKEQLPAKNSSNLLPSNSYPALTDYVHPYKLSRKLYRMPKDYLGFTWSKSDNVEKSSNETLMLSAAFGDSHGYPITRSNFVRAMITFAVRRCTFKTWINNKDCYTKPNINIIKNDIDNYYKFIVDCVIYSLFDSSKSDQTSLSNLIFRNKSFNIKNHFFWASKDLMKKLSQKYKNNDTEAQVLKDKNRFVYNWLTTPQGVLNNQVPLEITDNIANNVYKISISLIKDTFRYRNEFNAEYPKYSFNNWDIGWAQLSKLTRLMKNKMVDDNAVSMDKSHMKHLLKQLKLQINKHIYSYGFLNQTFDK